MSTVEVTPEESDSDAEEILGALTWLAEAHRNHDFVTERPPPLPEMIDFGARDLVPLRENLQYEPRSIAVSPAGDAAAIGTKSGEIRLVRWNEKQSAWIPHSPTVVSRSPDRAGPLSPVRALAFIGPDLLAAGSGRGEFHLFDARSGESWPEPVDKDATSTTHGWFESVHGHSHADRSGRADYGRACCPRVDQRPRAPPSDPRKGPVSVGDHDRGPAGDSSEEWR